ncbi:hypothetical protein DNTS_003328 [Danionella cerebrum]|uniref:Ig-like domain-containing protein n=1 Tax=Danionella cerebrum TaxID=2873325 RepID=A0A553QNV3_9TELE|nr:hypothetical protein DNTS_003328 [Danionella translucida]
MENLILMFFFILSRGSCSSGESCDYKAVGETVQIPLFDQELESSHHLTWTQNNTRLYSKRGSSVWKNVGEVDVYGSLILENIQMNGSGEYKAEVFDGEGLRIKKTEHRLCVQGSPLEPQSTFRMFFTRTPLAHQPSDHSLVVTGGRWSFIISTSQKFSSDIIKGPVFLIVYAPPSQQNESHHVCVPEPVSKPSLQEQCSDAGVTLICCGRNSGELLVSWRNNTEKLTWNTSTVHLKASEITPGDSFSCSVRNMISEEWAEELQPSCSNKGISSSSTRGGHHGEFLPASNYAQGGPHHVTEKDEEHREDAADGASEDDTPFLGLNWLLAAGGSFLIIFIIIVCVCCCCRRSSRKDKGGVPFGSSSATGVSFIFEICPFGYCLAQDQCSSAEFKSSFSFKKSEENEYRLANLMPDYSNVPDPQNKQKIQKAPKGLRPLPPLPSPREKSYLQ